MTAAKIRQSEFAEKHGLKPGEVKALRDKHLVEGTDFWSEGRAIFWTMESAEKVERAIYSMIVIEETPIPGAVIANVLAEPLPQGFKFESVPITSLQARIIKPCNNKRFVYANLNGVQITVNVGNTRWQKLKGKNITVRKNPDSDSYTFIP